MTSCSRKWSQHCSHHVRAVQCQLVPSLYSVLSTCPAMLLHSCRTRHKQRTTLHTGCSAAEIDAMMTRKIVHSIRVAIWRSQERTPAFPRLLQKSLHSLSPAISPGTAEAAATCDGWKQRQMKRSDLAHGAVVPLIVADIICGSKEIRVAKVGKG